MSTSSFKNFPFQIAGWGDSGLQQKSTVLRQGTISGMSPDECLNRYPTLLVDKDIQICAMGWDGTDTGLGDSGSPLMASVILLPSRNNVLRRGTLQLRIWASGLHENFLIL